MDNHDVRDTLTSIVILTKNELEFTRICVDSILANTPERYELIFVDNGSIDGTVEYLRSIDGAVVIENTENLGFGGGSNQGIAVSNGDEILLLNNDTVVTPGWLGKMRSHLYARPLCGAVGPRSNRVAGVQQIPEAEITYNTDTLDGFDEFLSSFTPEYGGEGKVTERVIGFCMLIRREVIDRIGGFDLRFGLGNFEDDDICLRIWISGYRCYIADDVFVHHFGSRTFIGQQIPLWKTSDDNWSKFVVKWRIPQEWISSEHKGYVAKEIISATSFYPPIHYSPLVAVPDSGESLDVERKAFALLVCADRFDPAGTSDAFRSCASVFSEHDDVTVIVRVDPSDTTSLRELELVADDFDGLCDVVVVQGSDLNDEAVVRASDAVVCFGRCERALRGIARLYRKQDVIPEAIDAIRSSLRAA